MADGANRGGRGHASAAHFRPHFGRTEVPTVTRPVVDALPDPVPTAHVKHNATEKRRADARGGSADANPTSPGWCWGRAKPFASFLMRNDQQSAPMACLRQEVVTADRGLDAIRNQVRIIAPDTQPGCRRVAR